MAKQRSRQQKTGATGEGLVAWLAQKSGGWIVRPQHADFGVDLELELDEPTVAGQLLKIQVKASETVERRDGKIGCTVPRSLVHLAENLRVPLILVRVDVATEQAWYLWIQRWWLSAREKGVRFDRLPEESMAWIPEEDELLVGLQGELPRLARGHTREQLVLSLSDTVRAAIHQGDVHLLSALTDLLEGVGPLPDPFPIASIIDRVVTMGSAIWGTTDGNELSRVLFCLCRSFGDRFSVDQIDRLVWRADAYSRTGINALDLLYTNFQERTVGLALAQRYAGYENKRPAFFCALRETYPGKSEFGLPRFAGGFHAHGFRLPEFDNGMLFDKIANRGASAILDVVQQT